MIFQINCVSREGTEIIQTIKRTTNPLLFPLFRPMFRDKDGIFCLSVSLLERISESNPMIEEFCAMHEHLKRLKALHQLSLRRVTPSMIPPKTNRMKRREHFDRNAAIKALGAMTNKFDMLNHSGKAVESQSREHFTFNDTRCDSAHEKHRH